MASTWHELYTNPANNGRVLRYCQWLPRDSVYSNRQISVGREGILGFVITWVESAPQAWSPEAEVTVDGGLGSDFRSQAPCKSQWTCALPEILALGDRKGDSWGGQAGVAPLSRDLSSTERPCLEQ